jgi:glycosyltransferase involved in cell wall biosynthesis
MPTVSIIVPCLNEEATIRGLLDAVYCQTFSLSDLEVIIADGMSTDRTREVISDFHKTHQNMAIRVVDNPVRNIPAGLNAALKVTRGDYIIRLDAHSAPSKQYVELCVQALNAKKGDNVGGIWKIKPGANTITARSIALAASNPLGVGDAFYRFGKNAGYVDTVPFGSFQREIFDKIGCFDESLLTNEDYELNARLRQSGGKIWLDPEIQSVYFARPTFISLMKQYWRYGFWKSHMLRKYPSTIRWRQALPPLFVLGVVIFVGAGFLFSPAWQLLGLGMFVYGLLLAISAIPAAYTHKDIRLIIMIPLAISVMHFSWGSGMLWGLLHPVK